MSKEESMTYIDNSLIFFIFNKINTLNECDIVSICRKYYNDDEISSSKKLINEIYDKIDENINRKGINKFNSELQDIIKIIKLNDKPTNIKFCITNCNRLPPVGFDNIDITALIDHLSDLRFEVSDLRFEVIKTSRLVNPLAELKNEVDD